MRAGLCTPSETTSRSLSSSSLWGMTAAFCRSIQAHFIFKRALLASSCVEGDVCVCRASGVDDDSTGSELCMALGGAGDAVVCSMVCSSSESWYRLGSGRCNVARFSRRRRADMLCISRCSLSESPRGCLAGAGASISDTSLSAACKGRGGSAVSCSAASGGELGAARCCASARSLCIRFVRSSERGEKRASFGSAASSSDEKKSRGGDGCFLRMRDTNEGTAPSSASDSRSVSRSDPNALLPGGGPEAMLVS